MSIPDTQLETWSKPGAMTTATQTYTSIKNALAGGAWPIANAPDIYLQGSYRNSTNIYAESDVDVIVEIGGVVNWDTSALLPIQAQGVNSTFHPVPYQWAEGHRDTLAALRAYYDPANVTPGKKAIKVETAYRTSDVVVAIEHRKYQSSILGQVTYIPGIAIWIPSDAGWITNFPKQHYDNGVTKNDRTGGLFKPTVRMFKNANLYLVARKMIDAGTAPSYATECLVYSVPDDKFDVDHGQTFCNVVNWAHENLASIRRVSEQGNMTGADRGLWSLTAARSYVDALINLWNNYCT